MEDHLRIQYFSSRKLKPLLLAFFVTYRCNLKCCYCDYARYNHSHKFPELNTTQTIEILKLCRSIPAIAFSGGEPLLRDDIDLIVKTARYLGFKPISLFTNGLLLPKHEKILGDLDFLQISLDSLDEKIQDRIFAVKQSGLTHQLIDIITFYARQQQKRHFRINLNAVLMPEQLDEILRLYHFARKIDIKLTICPQLSEDGQPVPALTADQKYFAVIDHLIKLKAENGTVMDTSEFLLHIRDFRTFHCYPYLTPRIYPDGKLVGPCPVIIEKSYPLLEIGSWEKAFAALRTDFGDNYLCPRNCYLPCYLETSTLMVHPWESFKKLFRLKNKIKKVDEMQPLGSNQLAGPDPAENFQPDHQTRQTTIPEVL
jgi:MoaA/NifB/PqqE/SkfB family radical SAM enzyme